METVQSRRQSLQSLYLLVELPLKICDFDLRVTRLFPFLIQLYSQLNVFLVQGKVLAEKSRLLSLEVVDADTVARIDPEFLKLLVSIQEIKLQPIPYTLPIRDSVEESVALLRTCK